MTPRHAFASARQAGFTLIELMVGLTLGMLTVAIITQVVVLAEGQKRSTTHGADAQLNGALALYAIQQEAQMAGYGVSANPDALGCSVRYNFGGTAASFTLAPVLISNGSNGSDVITFLRSGKPSFSVPIRVMGNHAKAETSFNVQSSMGVAQGDLLVAVPKAQDAANWCSIFEASAGATATTVAHVADAGWNPAASIFPNNGYVAESYLVNLGNIALRQFALDANQTLQKSELVKGTGGFSAPQDMQPQIVMLRALYGKDTNSDGVVDQYTRDTPATNLEWQQVLSLRVLVVARSAQFEKDAVNSPDVDATAKTVSWDLGPTDGVTVSGAAACHTGRQCLSVSLAFLGSDWSHYRYKVYETVIPLRNRLWNS